MCWVIESARKKFGRFRFAAYVDHSKNADRYTHTNADTCTIVIASFIVYTHISQSMVANLNRFELEMAWNSTGWPYHLFSVEIFRHRYCMCSMCVFFFTINIKARPLYVCACVRIETGRYSKSLNNKRMKKMLPNSLSHLNNEKLSSAL